MKETTCCFTGHRRLSADSAPLISARLERIVTELIRRGFDTFISGGAMGFDMLAAETVLALKEPCPHIRLSLALPCFDQDAKWPENQRARLMELIKRADHVVHTSAYYYQGCMHLRDRYLVDRSGVCVCFLTQNTGGTEYTVRYAASKGLEVINLAEPERCAKIV